MHPARLWSSPSAPGLPRPRGDAPLRGRRVPGSCTAPPPTRGCTCFGLAPMVSLRGSPAHAGMHPRPPLPHCRRVRLPAHAGMHPRPPLPHCRRVRLPRPRGDAPLSEAVQVGRSKAPPPTRGCTPGLCDGARRLKGSPAHAGMHPSRREHLRPSARLPRPRGDAPFHIEQPDGAVVAPPPTRGCTPDLGGRREGVAGSPAHAGMHPVGIFARLR